MSLDFFVEPTNVASRRTIECLGATLRTDVTFEPVVIQGTPRETVQYVLHRDDLVRSAAE